MAADAAAGVIVAAVAAGADSNPRADDEPPHHSSLDGRLVYNPSGRFFATSNSMQDFVLIVDDEPAVRELLTTQLTFLRFEAEHTGDPTTALEAVAGPNPPDLILLDIEMPNMNGLEFARMIRGTDQFADLPIVALTARAQTGDRDACIEAGCDAYMSKPLRPLDLVALITQLTQLG